MSITDSDFSLPTIFVENSLKAFTESANKPYVISGVNKITFSKDEYVVKLNSSERMSPNAAMRETLASLIAIEVGIPTPVPALIEVSDVFVKSRLGFEDYQRFNQSIGINYGNKFLGDNVIQFMPVIPESYEGLKKLLQEIFIFDVFIENTDRKVNTPNLMMKDHIVYVIDHEIAFSFIHALFSNNKPWIFNNEIYELIRIHCLYSNLKGKKFLANDFFEEFSKLNDTFWTKAYKLLPNQWKLNDFFKIRDYLCLKIEHITDFKNEIMEVLK
jgi:hypothetical protein